MVKGREGPQAKRAINKGEKGKKKKGEEKGEVNLNFQKYYPFNQNSPMERTRGLLSLLLLFLHIAKLHT